MDENQEIITDTTTPEETQPEEDITEPQEPVIEEPVPPPPVLYCYDEKTKEYTGTAEPLVDPKTEEYLKWGFSAWEAPPEVEEGQKAVILNGHWTVMSDNRDKKQITKNMSNREKLHVKLIRDSDKTDILYILTFENEKLVWESENLEEEKFSDEIYREFIENHDIIYKNRKTHADILIGHFAYAFDFNFDYGLKYVLDNKYYEKLYKRFNFKDIKTNKRFEEVYNITNNYIKERVKAK